MASAVVVVAAQAWQIFHGPEHAFLAELAQLCVSLRNLDEMAHPPGLTICQAAV